jgi:hypothetical protein
MKTMSRLESDIHTCITHANLKNLTDAVDGNGKKRKALTGKNKLS